MKKLLYSFIALLLGSLSCISEVETNDLVPDQLLGKWGGPHIEMNATQKGITLEFDCAVGEITDRFTLKADNSFSVQGIYRLLQGAAMANTQATNMPATYEGVLKGSKLELKVIVGAGSTVQSYVIEKNAEPNLVRCL